MIKQGKVNFLIDAQWGSTGKGKLAGWLYENSDTEIRLCISDNMPNAGHTLVRDGKEFVLKALPTGCFFNCECLIGPQAVISEAQFFKEMEMVKEEMGQYPAITIHPLACIVTDEDKESETSIVKSMASTGQGSCAATVKKMWRDGTAVLAKDVPALQPYVGDTVSLLHVSLDKGQSALSEGSQGFDLSLNHGHHYPNVTSRDCLIGRMMDNAGIPVKQVGDIIASFRVFPIRVGNTENTSGPYYDDQTELDWAYISDLLGQKVEERTTVTQRVRRVFTFSDQQTHKFCQYVRPDYAFLNFVNYYSDVSRRAEKVASIAHLLSGYGCDLALLGTGADQKDMIHTSTEEILSKKESLFG